jgi:hypothetical protein
MKSRKKSSKGEPSGTIGCGPEEAATVVEVVMFTTAGLTFSASSAKLAGRFCASAGMACASASAVPITSAQNACSGACRMVEWVRTCGVTPISLQCHERIQSDPEVGLIL